MNEYYYFCSAIILFIISSNRAQDETSSIDVNEEVAEYMKTFEGRDDQADSTLPTLEDITIVQFQYPSDLQLTLSRQSR